MAWWIAITLAGVLNATFFCALGAWDPKDKDKRWNGLWFLILGIVGYSAGIYLAVSIP